MGQNHYIALELCLRQQFSSEIPAKNVTCLDIIYAGKSVTEDSIFHLASCTYCHLSGHYAARLYFCTSFALQIALYGIFLWFEIFHFIPLSVSSL